MIEEWKDIKGYEGLYQVSNLGRVKSLERIDNNSHLVKEKILTPIPNRCGYLRVCLYGDGINKFFSIHRLVAEAFIPNPDNLSFVNHKDEDKTNCVDSNLEWCTAEYNSNYGTRKQRLKNRLTNRKDLSKSVVQIGKTTGEIIKTYPSAMEASRQTGINQGNISRCCKGRQKTSRGFIWKYAG